MKYILITLFAIASFGFTTNLNTTNKTTSTMKKGVDLNKLCKTWYIILISVELEDGTVEEIDNANADSFTLNKNNTLKIIGKKEVFNATWELSSNNSINITIEDELTTMSINRLDNTTLILKGEFGEEMAKIVFSTKKP